MRGFAWVFAVVLAVAQPVAAADEIWMARLDGSVNPASVDYLIQTIKDSVGKLVPPKFAARRGHDARSTAVPGQQERM